MPTSNVAVPSSRERFVCSLVAGGAIHLLAFSSLLGNTGTDPLTRDFALQDESRSHLVSLFESEPLFDAVPQAASEPLFDAEQAASEPEEKARSEKARDTAENARTASAIAPGTIAAAQSSDSPARLPRVSDFPTEILGGPLDAAAPMSGRQGMRTNASGQGISGQRSASTEHAAARLHLKAAPQCSDLFPHQASSDSGFVIVEIKLDSAGTPQLTRVVEEYPVRQGFARAAEACAERFEFFSLDVDRDAATRLRSIIKLRFDRAA